ncbi:Hsp70 family protein [Fuerstiella marisgermanici]|uniref:Heat shock protein 70 n=1 Tax=Fuerstiella marisgermanici TaxID=1891926 RepID=A0A1P8WRV0_9PLAN|nr:Hsp70 family protein [Fuerstiella marisgermanici]APZ96777.1 Heat shock protein 70 [Fuerstiella marisgermanici]
MKFLDGRTVGIDLGTTYSAIAYLDDNGDPTLAPNADGRTITPSVVLLDDDRVVVGPSFERISVASPDQIVEAIKREMGNKDYHVIYQNKKLTPEFVSALILKKMKQDAEKVIGPISNAVITVPYYFNDVRRKATQDAGRIAGLNVIDIINEPTAATLAYAWQQGELGRTDLKSDEKTILVYDLGGGTFDVTIVRYTPTSFRVLATDGDVMLGGLDWSRRLTDHLVEQFKQKYGEDPSQDPEAMMAFNQESEDVKRDLSDKSQVPVSVYYKGKTLTVSLTRAEFERMTADLLQRTKDTAELVMQQAGVKAGMLDEVVLVGGSTLMPVVEQMLLEVTGREPNRDLMPERAVAEGAAIHAAILQARSGNTDHVTDAVRRRLNTVKTSDVNSHSLGIKVSDPSDKSRKINHIMIPKNTPVPHSVHQRFGTNVAGQQRVHVEILEGDAADPAACEQIGDFRVYNLPESLPKGAPIEITYSYDSSGRISATAKELTGNNEASAEIVRDGGMGDKEVTDALAALTEEYDIE